ncbi:MAG TPA: hypothetical protein VF706_04640, partial [Solirubrobacteraceae bacterium]
MIREIGMAARYRPPRIRLGARPPLTLLALLALALCSALATDGCGAARPGKPLELGASAKLPISRTSHVVTIVLENEERSAVIGSAAAPYVNALARRYGTMTESFAITHPSLPNYLA